MTHKDIFTKFMIEYDKANVTSSYPSLTEYEIATFLDKAYMALIAQKVTGNNVRRAPFEADIKSISDLQPLVTSQLLFLGADGSASKAKNLYPKTDYPDAPLESGWEVRTMPDNMRSTEIPKDMLYFVAATVPLDMHEIAGWMNDVAYDNENIIKPMDNKDSDYNDNKYKRYRMANVNITTHQAAKQFFATSSNIPWIKNPVCYLEDNRVFLLLDPVIGTPELKYFDPKTKEDKTGEWMSMTYIKKPAPFVKDLEKLKASLSPESKEIATEYTIDSDQYFLIFDIDYYYGTDKRKLHINDIKVCKETSLESDTYYLEYNTDTYDPTDLKAADFVENATIFNSTVVCSGTDDSFRLNPSCSFAVIYKDESDPQNKTCSQLFVFTYDELYQIVKSHITDLSADQSLNIQVLTIPSATSVIYLPGYQLVSLDVDPGAYIDQYKTAYDNVIQFGYSEYVLLNRSIRSGQILKDLDGNTLDSHYTFELDNVAAEELISLAITYALENVESPRLNTHLGMRGLES